MLGASKVSLQDHVHCARTIPERGEGSMKGGEGSMEGGRGQ